MATHVCFIDIPQEGLHRQQHHASSNRRSSSRHKERSLSPISPAPSSPRYERNMGFFHQLSRRFGLKSSDDLVYAAGGEDDSHSSSTDSCSSTTGTLPRMQTSITNSTTSSTTTTHSGIATKDAMLLLHQGSSMEHLSCASSDTSSTLDINDELQTLHSNNNAAAATANERKLSTASKSSTRSSFSRLHRRSTSSIRRAFEGISISTARSLSCSGGTTPQQQQSAAASPAKSALKTTSASELHKRSTSVSATTAAAKSKSQPTPPQRILRQPVSYTYLKGMSGLPTQRVPRNAVYCSYVRR